MMVATPFSTLASVEFMRMARMTGEALAARMTRDQRGASAAGVERAPGGSFGSMMGAVDSIGASSSIEVAASPGLVAAATEPVARFEPVAWSSD